MHNIPITIHATWTIHQKHTNHTLHKVDCKTSSQSTKRYATTLQYTGMPYHSHSQHINRNKSGLLHIPTIFNNIFFMTYHTVGCIILSHHVTLYQTIILAMWALFIYWNSTTPSHLLSVTSHMQHGPKMPRSLDL